MYNRITQLFERQRSSILSIFFTAGFPELNSTARIIYALEQNGVDLIEVGIPYSDPLADGPVIQETSTVALRNGMTIDTLFHQLDELSSEVHVPLILMGYLNPVLQYGMERFCQRAAQCGVSGVILPDLPLDEYEGLYRQHFEGNNLKFIFLVTPATSTDRIRRIDSISSGFIYAVSSSSTTGKEDGFPSSQVEYLERLKLDSIVKRVRESGYKPTFVKTFSNRYLVCIGTAEVDIRTIGTLPGVKDVHVVEDPNKLVSRQWRVTPTSIDLGDGVTISRSQFTIAAGPCSIESEEQVVKTVSFLKEQNVSIMRGGVFKPRSSPYAFRGLGIKGLELFARHCRANGIKVVSEVMQVSQIEPMCPYVDIFQVGTRNAQNFNLLDELGKVNKPVLLKRGMSQTLTDFLASAEYIFSSGNERIILCERGIRAFEKEYRNTLDLNAIPYLKDKSHLPVFCDPSHGIGIREYVEPMALAAQMAGADGVLLEIHQTPERAASDGQQTLNFEEAQQVFRKLRMLENIKTRWGR